MLELLTVFSFFFDSARISTCLLSVWGHIKHAYAHPLAVDASFPRCPEVPINTHLSGFLSLCAATRQHRPRCQFICLALVNPASESKSPAMVLFRPFIKPFEFELAQLFNRVVVVWWMDGAKQNSGRTFTPWSRVYPPLAATHDDLSLKICLHGNNERCSFNYVHGGAAKKNKNVWPRRMRTAMAQPGAHDIK